MGQEDAGGGPVASVGRKTAENIPWEYSAQQIGLDASETVDV
jgi:hypothetical protein